MIDRSSKEVLFEPAGRNLFENILSLRKLLGRLDVPFGENDSVGIKIHWGERGNHSFLPPDYTAEIVEWVKSFGAKPFVFDTTVLYSGGRRDGADSLETAAEHGFTEENIGCPLVIADGLDGRDVVDVPSGLKHFETVQVASVIQKADGFVVFSHFKGHLEAGFGGAIKNISMGFASRAQKQRIHSDAYPVLKKGKCIKCGNCQDVCPVGAVSIDSENFPIFDLEKCIGCAQCIALCPAVALKIFWNTDSRTFQEKLAETALAIWKIIERKTVLINAAVKITKDCDCMPGKNEFIANDVGFFGGYDPFEIDRKTVEKIGDNIIDNAHPNILWRVQFSNIF